jgi:hypothetical protein
MSLGLLVRYIPDDMLLTGNLPTHLWIFRKTYQLYLLTAPKLCEKIIEYPPLQWYFM